MASAERRHTSAPAESEKGRDTRGARFGGRSSCTSCFTESLGKSPIDLDGGDGNERAAKKPYGILHEAS